MKAIKNRVLKYFGKTDEWRRMIVRFLLLVFVVICAIYTYECLTGHDGSSSDDPVFWGSLTVVFTFMFFLTFKLKNCQNLYFVILLFAGGFVLSSNFLSAGGVSSGVPMLLLLMGLLLVFLLLDGWRFYVALVAVLAADVYVHIFSLVHPEQVVVTVAYNRIVIIGLIYLISIGIIIGMIIRLQIYRLEKEMQLSQERQKEIERISESKSLFLASMSHEIRTPINAVLGMNEMILKESKDEQILKYASNAYNSGNALLSIINDVLDISKIEAGKLEIVNAEYDLPSLISDCYHMTLSRARKKGLDFIVECDENIPSHFNGDMFHIRQIVVNFITNAIKYTDNGFARLSVSGERKDDDFLLRFAVSDSGIGLKQEDMEKLFTNFQRFDLKRNQSVEGTGLGLSICKQLAELMGGKVNVESVYGKGSTFVCEIPQRIVSDVPIGKLNLDITVEGLNVTEKNSFIAPDARILVVDDVEMNLFVFTSLLKEHKMKIDTALSGRKCLELLKDNTYDIIFLDHLMPEMDGMETFAKMKELNLITPDIPVIMLTANAISGEKEKYLSTGFTSYLSKPIKSVKLDNILLQYLPKGLIETVDKSELAGNAVMEKAEKESAGMFKTEADISPELIDMKIGLSYSGDSKESYLLILGSYVKNGSGNLDKIKMLWEAENWKDYTTSVHALKSTSLTIGAEGLSRLAEEMELAGKSENYTLIKEKNEELLKLYKDVLDECRKIIDYYNGTSTQYDDKKSSAEVSGSTDKTADPDGSMNEITKEKLLEMRNKLKEACMAFSSKEIDSVIEELSSYTYQGVRLSEKMIKVKELADEFEYIEAGELTEKIFDEIGEN